MNERTSPNQQKPPKDVVGDIAYWISIILSVIGVIAWLVNTCTGPKHPAPVDAPRPAIERPAPAKPAPAPPASIRD